VKRKPPDRNAPRKGGLGSKAAPSKSSGLKASSGFKSAPGLKAGPPDRRELVKRAALNALKRAQRAAAKAGVELSAWEGEFLDSVGERVKTYGRAFADPDKGGPGQAFSMMQTVKLKEITAKAKGEKRAFPGRRKARPPPDE